MSKIPLCKVENYLLTTWGYVYILKTSRGLYCKVLNYMGLECHVFYIYMFWLFQPFLFLNKGNFDIFIGFVMNNHFRHFDTLIQIMRGLVIYNF